MSVVCLESLTFGLGHLVSAADALGERLVLLTRDPAYYAYELERLAPMPSTSWRSTPSTWSRWRTFCTGLPGYAA